MSTPPSLPAEEPGGFHAGTAGHGGGSPHRHAAAGDAEGHPAGGRPGLQHEDDEDAVYDDEEAAAESGSNARGSGLRAETAEGKLLRPNTCCICWEPWASSGAHRICCIPCGHVYGRLCLERWLIRCGGAAAKCPECGGQYEHSHILNLYPATERLWDDCCQEQAPRHALMEEEAIRQVVKAAMEEIAQKDKVIAKMEGKIARMARIQEIRVTLTKILETEKRIGLLKEINRMLYVLIVVLLFASVALFIKL